MRNWIMIQRWDYVPKWETTIIPQPTIPVIWYGDLDPTTPEKLSRIMELGAEISARLRTATE